MALEELCRAYWYPLYAFARARFGDRDAALDATQGFFADLLEREALSAADPERGRFRSFLLRSFNNYLSGEQRRERALKRTPVGGIFRIDVEEGERRYSAEPADHRTPETVWDRRWAAAVLSRAAGRLESEYRTRGKAGLFQALRPYLDGTAESGYREVARELDTNEGTVAVAVSRLRRRYRELLVREVGDTVENPESALSELRHLIEVLRGD